LCGWRTWRLLHNLKAKVDGLQARWFSRLRPEHQERERLRLLVSYRRQFLDALRRQGDTEAEQVRREYHAKLGFACDFPRVLLFRA
jgi:hypothetical protein